MSEPVSEENSADSQQNVKDSTYKKAAKYWQNVEPTISGMLGGQNVGFLDIQASKNFLNLIFKHKPAPCRTKCLDCGAGIGRVSKNLLSEYFDSIDLVEQDAIFCNKARESLNASGKLGEIYNVGLQDFNDSGKRYDVIWIQWVLGHLTDDDLLALFIRISQMLNKNGLIIVKENFTKDNQTIVDEVDSSVTRPLAKFKKIVKQAELKIIRENQQTNFPKELFPVYMIAMKTKKI